MRICRGREVPLPLRCKLLQAHAERLPQPVAGRYAGSFLAAAQPLFGGCQQVPRRLHQIHLAKMVQQQLLCHPAHSRPTICKTLVF